MKKAQAPVLLYFFMLLTLQSCIIFNFVGGHNSLTRFDMTAKYSRVLEVADSLFSTNNYSIIRKYNNTGYDKGRFRYYELTNENIIFTIQLLGEENEWKGKSNYSEISLRSLRVANILIDPDRKLSKSEKELFEKGVSKVKTLFVEPIIFNLR